MELKFTKMNGAGNDFILIDNRDDSISLSRADIAWICDRHRGVGGDGLLAVEPPGDAQADFKMRYYNADGGEAEMCGNGARCFARFVKSLGWKGQELRFSTPAGVISATFEGSLVKIVMSDPTDIQLNQTIQLRAGSRAIHSINTGVPHAILFVRDAGKAPVRTVGPEIRNHEAFQPKGTNVNFVAVQSGELIRVRTYERGVENETLACGTGVVAAAIVSHLIHKVPVPVRVVVQGGETLEVGFKAEGQSVKEVFLRGPADFAFEGKLALPNKA